MSDAIFALRGERFHPSELARGPWDPNAQHGGAPAGLLARAIEQTESPEPMHVARITYEFLRPVPLEPLELTTEVVRPGKRVQLVGGALRAGGVEVCRALGLRIRRKPVEAPGPPSTVMTPGPDQGQTATFRVDVETMFAVHGMEVRFTRGEWNEPGPAAAWFRLRFPLVAGEEPSPLQRMACAADFPNGLSSAVSWDDYLFVNPDMTMHVERPAIGEWVGVDAVTRLGPDGTGVSEAVLHDTSGRVGRSVQALLFDRR